MSRNQESPFRQSFCDLFQGVLGAIANILSACCYKDQSRLFSHRIGAPIGVIKVIPAKMSFCRIRKIFEGLVLEIGVLGVIATPHLGVITTSPYSSTIFGRVRL